MEDSGLMDAECLANLLADDERAEFERSGFVMVRGALDRARVERLRDVAQVADGAFRAEPAVGPFHTLNQHDLIGRHDAYLDLVDLPTTFPKVWGILGWHIQVFHTQLLVTPPVPPEAGPGAYGWHQDNNRMNLDLGVDLGPGPQPRVSMKVGYFLTDLPEPGMGNLCVVPGSHLLGRPQFAIGEQPDGAVEVTARAGDAILFDRRLWHSASNNHSVVTRVFVTVGYSYRWLRPKSRIDPDRVPGTTDPIRRQLLGATSSVNAWFDPEEEDVPLRTWIREHLGDEAVVA
jgi:ectoine hydroxylase